MALNPQIIPWIAVAPMVLITVVLLLWSFLGARRQGRVHGRRVGKFIVFTVAWVAMMIGLYLGSLHLFFIPRGKTLCQAHHAKFSNLVFSRSRGLKGGPIAPRGVECQREDLPPGDPDKYFTIKGQFFSSNGIIEFFCGLFISLGYLFGPLILLILFFMPRRRSEETEGIKNVS